MIILAEEKAGRVYGYNENKVIIVNQPGNLYNYTDTTVAIKRDSKIYVYGLENKLIAESGYDSRHAKEDLGILLEVNNK